MTMTKRPIDGLVLIDKPQDLTSNAVLQRVKRLFCAQKAGHTGSLDPLATGMLPICLGEATKFSQYLLNADKCYLVTGALGGVTDTGDIKGKMIHQVENVSVNLNQMQAAVQSFKGDIQQIPPMYSALKYQGRPLYELARKGIEIERLPRQITIYDIELLSFDGTLFRLRVRCSKGTYIRSLVMDIGDQLGVGAHVTELHRCYTAGFEKENMWSLDQLMSQDEATRMACLLPMDSMVASFPSVQLSTEEALSLFQGRTLTKNLAFNDEEIVRMYEHSGLFLGLGHYHPTDNILKAKRMVQRPV